MSLPAQRRPLLKQPHAERRLMRRLQRPTRKNCGRLKEQSRPKHVLSLPRRTRENGRHASTPHRRRWHSSRLRMPLLNPALRQQSVKNANGNASAKLQRRKLTHWNCCFRRQRPTSKCAIHSSVLFQQSLRNYKASTLRVTGTSKRLLTQVRQHALLLRGRRTWRRSLKKPLLLQRLKWQPQKQNKQGLSTWHKSMHSSASKAARCGRTHELHGAKHVIKKRSASQNGRSP
mmetsp:Transcript_55622/g.101968  ORF Transcript_55622/g.101968 Transcript_55622/m.101968 type:complete len:231 (+) Transcript_55622:1129-1821(+)